MPESGSVQPRLLSGMVLAAVGGVFAMLLLMGGTGREAATLDDGWAARPLAAAPPPGSSRDGVTATRRASRVPTYIRIGGPEPEPDPVELALETLRGRL